MNLFSSQGGRLDNQFIGYAHPRVTQAMNNALLAEFTPQEIKKALFQMGDLKAPGPDGMPAIFYKSFWFSMGVKCHLGGMIRTLF